MTVARLASPNGVRSVVTDSLLVDINCCSSAAHAAAIPNLRFSDRLVAGWCTLFIRASRLIRSAIVLKPSTVLHL